jgi:hypothetical protein
MGKWTNVGVPYATASRSLLGADYGIIGISSASTASTTTMYHASSLEGVS